MVNMSTKIYEIAKRKIILEYPIYELQRKHIILLVYC